MGLFSYFQKESVPSASELQAAGAKVIDVRTPGEYAGGHVTGARNIDVARGDFPRAISGLDNRRTYVVYCQSGARSQRAAQIMKSAGLTVVDGGGIGNMAANGWQTGR